MEVNDQGLSASREEEMSTLEASDSLANPQACISAEEGTQGLAELRRKKLEQMSSQLRAETALLPDEQLEGPAGDRSVTFDLHNLTKKEREQIVKRALATTDQDNGTYYQKYRSRLDR
jgi:hypothetical protein